MRPHRGRHDRCRSTSARSSVRDFGTIYEGLLESEPRRREGRPDRRSARAPGVPAKSGDEVLAPPRAAVYFHSASGERKATGSYFTPDIVVEHLLDSRSNPCSLGTWNESPRLLDSGDEAEAARLFFDFRVADLAMGSGHFLVAAVDRIERRMRDFLDRAPHPAGDQRDTAPSATRRRGAGTRTTRPNSRSTRQRSCDASRATLHLRAGHQPDGRRTGPTRPVDQHLRPRAGHEQLRPRARLRRQPHRCGHDRRGAARAGPVRRDRAGQLLGPAITSTSSEPGNWLRDAATSTEADKAEVRAAAAAARKARMPPTRPSAVRRCCRGPPRARSNRPVTSMSNPDHRSARRGACDGSRGSEACTLPVPLPRGLPASNPGFDVLLGNPPWEEVMVEEPKFWLRIEPGLLGLKPADAKCRISQLRAERPDLLPVLQEEIDRQRTPGASFSPAHTQDSGRGTSTTIGSSPGAPGTCCVTGGHLGMVFPRIPARRGRQHDLARARARRRPVSTS